ncbi:MAG: hypothetical protein AABW48_06515 [Nanoarchaeota archaeon]
MDRVSVIKQVLTDLNNNKISYCVLRNYGFLLEKKATLAQSEKSVDLVLVNKDYIKFHQILLNHGFIKRKKPSYALKHIPYFRFEGIETISFDVQIGGVHWNDLCYLSENYILENRIKKSFFYVPSDENTFVMLLVHSILGKRYFKLEYKEILSSLVHKVDSPYVINRLSEIFSFKRAKLIYNLIVEDKFKEILKKNRLLMFLFVGKSMGRVSILVKLSLRYIKHTKVTGKLYPLISIIGPDGAGKSSAVEMLARNLRENRNKVSIIYTGRGRNHLLPISKLGRKYKNKERRKDEVKKPNSSNLNRRAFLYTLAAPLFTFDLLLRYILIMLPKRRNRNFVITDRYCSDIYLMENVPLVVRKLLLRLFPKPNLTFYLYNTPEVLHQRRPEESIEGLKRQLKLFGELESYLKPIKIKTDNQDEMNKIIFQETMAYILHSWY